MLKGLTIFLLVVASSYCDLQAQPRVRKGELSIASPFIWNNSYSTSYSSGNILEGKAISNGVNVKYAKDIFSSFYVEAGLGYLRQRFDINRPFNYKTPDGSLPLVATTEYSYDNLQLIAGIGYRQPIGLDWAGVAGVQYNCFQSFRQRYHQSYFPGQNEVQKRNFGIGEMITIRAGMERFVGENLSVNLTLLAPIHQSWKNDDMFVGPVYDDESQRIAKTTKSAGIEISVHWHFYRNGLKTGGTPVF